MFSFNLFKGLFLLWWAYFGLLLFLRFTVIFVGFGWFEKSLFFLCFSGMPKINKNRLIECSGARPSRLGGPGVVARGGKKGGVIGDLWSEIWSETWSDTQTRWVGGLCWHKFGNIWHNVTEHFLILLWHAWKCINKFLPKTIFLFFARRIPDLD